MTTPTEAKAKEVARKATPQIATCDMRGQLDPPYQLQDAIVEALSRAGLLADPRDVAAREACMAYHEYHRRISGSRETLISEQARSVWDAGAAYSQPYDDRAQKIADAEREALAGAERYFDSVGAFAKGGEFDKYMRPAIERLRAARTPPQRTVEQIIADLLKNPNWRQFNLVVPSETVAELRAALSRSEVKK